MKRAAPMWMAMALLSTRALAQPTPTPTPAASLSPTPKSAAEKIVKEVAAAVRSGHLAVDAAEGRVQSLDYRVDGGDLVFVGRGLRPSVVVSEISVDAGGRLRKAV